MTDHQPSSPEFSTVLVAGATSDDTKILIEALMRHGFKTVEVLGDEHVLHRSLLEQPDLILLEESLRAPRHICRELKKHSETHNIPIILVAEPATPQARADGLMAGVADYLVKPFLEAEALIRVDTHLRLCRMQKQLKAQNVQEHVELSRGFTHFAATMPGCMFTCHLRGDGSFVFPYASPGVKDICGLNPEDILLNSDAFSMRLRPDDLVRFHMAMMQSAGDLTLFDCDFRIVHPTKGMIWAEVRATPQREQDGSTLWHGFMTDITERKMTEELLWASEQSLRAIVDHSPDVVIRYDREYRRIYVSRSYSNIHGVASEVVLNKTPSEFWLSLSMTAAEFESALHRVMETGELSDIEFDWVKTPDDVTHHWLRAVPEYDREGNVVSVLAIARDITAMKRAEAEAAVHERDLRTLIEHIPDNIIRYDRDMRIRYVNQVMAATLGFSPAEVIGKGRDELVGSPALREYFSVLEQVIQTGKPADYLLVAGTSSFTRDIYDNIRFAPEFSPDGSVIGAIAIGRDLSRQRKLELEVLLREQEFRNLAENIPDMMVRYDRQCRRVYINPAYAHYSGTPIENAIGKTPSEVWTALMPSQEYTRRLNQVMDTKVSDQMLLEWFMPDGSIATHLMHAVAQCNDDGEVTGVLVIGHNITELKATERRLEESRAQLQQLTYHREEAREEERRRVAREIHDELGQLLSVLRLNVSTLEYGHGEANPDLLKKTAMMGKVIDQAIDMIHNLATRLRPAVLESGISLAVEWLVQEFSKSTGISCEFDSPASEVELEKDRALAIFRIVQESMTNILRHAEASLVKIAMYQLGQELKLKIKDNGKGFIPEKASKGSFGIIGMKERILMLGGSLEIYSAPGAGTELLINVPINEVKKEAES